MNLWVRSQNKENIIPIKNPICVYDNKIIYKESASYIITIGTYKTKERAIEVLDEIEERIMLINTINIAKDTDSLIACKNVLTEEKIKRLNYPYQMPEN